MYDNGRRLNRYAAKRRHKLRLMKNHMPIEYHNFNVYISDMENHYRDISMIYYRLPEHYEYAMKWHRSWWKQYSNFDKSAMKNSDHRRNRRMKRKIMYDIMSSPVDCIDDVEYMNLNRFKNEENMYW